MYCKQGARKTKIKEAFTSGNCLILENISGSIGIRSAYACSATRVLLIFTLGQVCCWLVCNSFAGEGTFVILWIWVFNCEPYLVLVKN